jgi:hypothetical protein
MSASLIHIFRAGRHTDMNGRRSDLTEADLAACAAAYDPAKHEAPLVVGHPTHDAPAYGWVKSISAAGADLEAEPGQLDPAFAEMVRAGRFKKRSAAFYRPDSPGNPVPGVYYLHHVGFLGAMPPAVKGLREVSFAEAADAEIVAFGEWEDAANAGLWRRLREWIIGKFGQDEADQVIPGYEVQSLEQSAQDQLRQDRGATPGPMFHEPQPETTVTDAELALIKADNERLKAENEQMKRRQADEAAAKRRADALAFAESLTGPGADGKARLAAKHRDTVVDLLMLAGQPGADGGVLMFGEGEAKAPAADKLKALLADMPPVLSFGEQATQGRAGGAAKPSDAEVALRCREYRARMEQQGQMITLGEAVDAVNAGRDRS